MIVTIEILLLAREKGMEVEMQLKLKLPRLRALEIGHYFPLDTQPNSAYINTKQLVKKLSFNKVKF